MMRAMTRALPVCLALVAAAGCRRGGPPEAPLTYDGSTAIASHVLVDAVPAFERRSKHRFARVAASGSGKGLRAALAGEVSVAGVTRSLTADELAHRPYYEIIGYDALAMFVNAANPVRGLTRAQLRDVLTGRVKSWNELGGERRPIVVCTEHVDSGRGTVEVLRTVALEGAPFGGVIEVEDPADCLTLVAQDPAAITAATVAFSIPGTRALPLDGIPPVEPNVRSGAYLLSRPMLLVTKDVPTGAVKEFFDFMRSAEGQSFEQAKFIGVP